MRNSNKPKLATASPFEIVALLEHPHLPKARKIRLAGKKTNRKKPRPILFRLEAPLARSVRLAGDFTSWEAAAIEMTQDPEGIWQVVVPLPVGRHAYRFIVDGEWCDDPRGTLRTPNSFGTHNTLVDVD